MRVNWQPLREPLVPQTFFELLQPLLPELHSPVSTNSGRGNQGVYLAPLDDALGLLLLKLIEDHADPAVHVHLVVLSDEGKAASDLLDDMQALQGVTISTERDALTKARLGQGLFRQRVAEVEPICRVTGLARQEFLVASHTNHGATATTASASAAPMACCSHPTSTSCLIATGSASIQAVNRSGNTRQLERLCAVGGFKE